MPKVWNMTCICCRSVFHLSHYVTELVSSAAASWVHGVKISNMERLLLVCAVWGQQIIREETKQTARSPWCWSTPIYHCRLQHAAPCSLRSCSHVEMNQEQGDSLLWAVLRAGLGTGASRKPSARSLLHPRDTAWEQFPNAIEFWLYHHFIFDEVITVLH